MGFRVRAAAAGVLMVLCMADLLWNQHVLMASAVIPSEPDSQYRAELSAKSALVDSIKEKDDYFFYRIEDTYSDTYDCLNDSMVYRYNGLSHYSTGDHLSVRMFLKAAGFNYNGLMDVYNPENTDTCDSFLDIKYLLTSKGVYTNENVFPAAVKTTGEVPSDIIMDSPFEFQKQIASAFSGKDCRDLFFPAEILSDEIMTTDDSQILIREIRLKTGCPGDLYFYIRNLGKKPQDMAVSVDGSFISGYANASAIKILDLGTFDEGQECTVSLTLRGDPEKAVFGDPQFCTENLSVLDTLSKEAKERGLQVSEPSPSEYFIENPENNSILLSIPYEESFRAYGTESGETYSISPAFGALTLINDVANEPVILEYTVPWFKQGMLAMLAGITLVLISSLPSLLRRKKES